ncbi:MAG TPA: hypothetical protein VH741_01965 [Candidatus Limnocylindrales bacterium]|jgi:hypothetical protein
MRVQPTHDPSLASGSAELSVGPAARALDQAGASRRVGAIWRG